MKAITGILLVTLMILTGCAHKMMRGSVAMKTSADEAHVCLGNGEVKQGDRVALYDNICTNEGRISGKNGGEKPTCRKAFLGNGIVEELLNEHYSLIKVDQGVAFKEGAIVERIR
jgi:hypothetical protein